MPSRRLRPPFGSISVFVWSQKQLLFKPTDCLNYLVVYNEFPPTPAPPLTLYLFNLLFSHMCLQRFALTTCASYSGLRTTRMVNTATFLKIQAKIRVVFCDAQL